MLALPTCTSKPTLIKHTTLFFCVQALLTMREGFEGEMDENNIEVAVVGEDRKFRILTPAEVRDYLDEAN
jgi:20S proteasome alpha/beta subunit